MNIHNKQCEAETLNAEIPNFKISKISKFPKFPENFLWKFEDRSQQTSKLLLLLRPNLISGWLGSGFGVVWGSFCAFRKERLRQFLFSPPFPKFNELLKISSKWVKLRAKDFN